MMAKASTRPHRAALTRFLRATGLANVPEEAPLVELLRTLADELDEGGGSRPRIEYRNALKDARAVLNDSVKRPVKRAPDVAPEPTPEEPAETPANVSKLATFRKTHGVGA